MKNIFFYVKSKPIKKCLPGCRHKFVKDLIDITPEKTEIIVYCEICEKTF